LWHTDVGAVILYGIEPQFPARGRAVVRGLLCNQDTRDQFRVRFNQRINNRIIPAIASGTVTVHFWPVIDKHSSQPVNDVFIVGMFSTSVNDSLTIVNCLL